MTTVQFDFEEMQLSGEGLMARGTATLESAYEDDSEFYVSEVILDGGRRLTRPSKINSADVFNGELFTMIVKQIEDDRTTHGKHAALEWSDAVAGNAPAVSALRHRRGMPLTYSTARVPEIGGRVS
ncbi:hypothetical protein [Rhizobium sp. No.120]